LNSFIFNKTNEFFIARIIIGLIEREKEISNLLFR